MQRSLAFYREILGFHPKTSFLLEGLRFAMLETGDGVYIELVETKQPMQPVGEGEVFWHPVLRTDRYMMHAIDRKEMGRFHCVWFAF